MRNSVLRKPIFHFFLLYFVTFFLAFFCFRGLIYSPLFSRSLYLKQFSHEFLSQNLKDGTDAQEYFHHQIVSSFGNQSPAKYNISFPCTNKVSTPRQPSSLSKGTLLAITIITVQRQADYHYLLQVAHKFLELLSECGPDCSNFHLFICNVDNSPLLHSDACLLSHLFPSVERRIQDQGDDSPNVFEREKQDYAFCLSKSLEMFNTEYVLLIEDDAVPKAEIFSAFFDLVRVRFPQEPLGGGLYTKFYHPERLQGYLNPEPMRILEWFGLGFLAGMALNWAYALIFSQSKFNWWQFITLAVYSMLLAEFFGRHYILELRRVLPALYNVVPASECCTPAMLFSEASAHRTLSYLEEIQCRPGYAKDTALYKELKTKGEWAWAIEPNMVTHIGLFSTLRGAIDVPEPQLL